MTNAQLETIFYSLGIVYFIVCFLLLIGLAIGAWIAYQKMQRLQDHVKATIAQKKAQLSLAKLGPLVVTTAVNRFLKHRD